MSVVEDILQMKIHMLEKQNKIDLLSHCAVCGKKKMTLIKTKELWLKNFD